jgi:hypothetical protein
MVNYVTYHCSQHVPGYFTGICIQFVTWIPSEARKEAKSG